MNNMHDVQLDKTETLSSMCDHVVKIEGWHKCHQLSVTIQDAWVTYFTHLTQQYCDCIYV